MPNWGDKLYPGTLGALFERVGIDTRRSHFCPVPGTTSAGEPIRPFRDLASSPADVAFVGGGDVLRFDGRTVAMDHLSVPSDRRASRVNRLRARAFARRRFLPGPGTWAPAGEWLPGRPAVLISAGVHTVPPNAAAHAAVSRYRAAWVRTLGGADHLAGAGIPRERIIVAPDMIFAMPDLEAPDAVAARGRAIFRARLGTDDAPVLFHAAQFHGWPLDRVDAALARLRGLPVATLSLGSYAGEDRLLTAAGRRHGIPALHDLSADEITAVLAAAGAVISTSMHAAIVAASFGTAVLVPGVGKTRDAFAVLPEPPTLHPVQDDGMRAEVDRLRGVRHPHSVSANRDAVVAAFAETLRAAELT